MNFKKTLYIFFTLLSLTTIVGFLYHPTALSLFLAASVNIISTLFKIGVNNTIAAELFASSLVADLHLVPAFVLFEVYNNPSESIALVYGALAASIFTIVLIIVEVLKDDKEEDF